MRHLPLLFFCLPFLLFSCKKDRGEGGNTDPVSDTCTYTAAGRMLHNAYLLDRIQDESGMAELTPTHLYVKVRIEDSEDFYAWDQLGIFLPFDWRFEPDAKGVRKGSEKGDMKGITLYGLLPARTSPPAGKYEIIDQRYLPEPGDPVWNLLYGTSDPSVRTGGGPISGRLTFFDPIAERYEPLAGVRIIVQDGGRIIQSVTQEDGSFSNPNRVQGNAAEVILRFDDPRMEIRTLDFDDLGGILSPNTISMGMLAKCAFSNLQLQIGPGTSNAKLQASAAGWFTYRQFMKFAQQKGYGIPNRKLNFWAAKDAPINDSYSAPMLRHVGAQQGARDLLVQLFGLPPAIANPLANLIKNDLPDIYAPYYSVNTNVTPKRHIEVLFHEFGHSTHYMQAGNAFWSRYIDHIFQNGGYGDGNDPLSGLVAMSEAWAEDFSKEAAAHFYGPEKYSHELRDANTWRGFPWIPVGIYYDLHDDADNEPFDRVKGFSFIEMYKAFGNDVDAPGKFIQSLIREYPATAAGQEANMDALLRLYGW